MPALRVVARKLGLQSFARALHGPIVGAWLGAGKWDRKPPKEALPVYFRVVRELEEAALCETCEDYSLICSFLLMLWSGPRFSDARRMSLQSLRNLSGDGYGVVSPVRAASLLLEGWSRSFWGQGFSAKLLQASTADPKRNFLIADGPRPMRYSSPLAQSRRCLCAFTSLNSQEAMKFTLHSLKASTLSWANQLDLSLEERAAQGHRRLTNSAGCVEKYRRDDLLPALPCQRCLIQAFAAGWMPGTPLATGIKLALEPAMLKFDGKPADPCAATDAEDAAVEGLLDSDVAVYQSDAEDIGNDCDALLASFEGPWIVVLPKGVKKPDEPGAWRLACRPRADMAGHYEVYNTDPFLRGFSLCQHSGCFG